jgi:hypothetical protein
MRRWRVGIATLSTISFVFAVLETFLFSHEILGIRSSQERARQIDEDPHKSNTTRLYDHEEEATKSTVTPYHGLAIVSAFNHRNDSFKGSGPVDASFAYIEKWYDSVHRHQDIQGVVLHNMFNQTMVKQWTSPQVHFVYVNSTSPSFRRGANRPINDLRFMVVETFLKNLYDEKNTSMNLTSFTTLPSYVLLSDSYDVSFLRNPFEYMQQTDKLLGTPHNSMSAKSIIINRANESTTDG